jgi:hypothetical protein
MSPFLIIERQVGSRLSSRKATQNAKPFSVLRANRVAPQR